MVKLISMVHRTSKATFLAIVLLLSGAIQAGGSPETTLLVVNAASPFSKAIANYYRNLRDIPANHVLYLTDIPSGPTLKITDFRRKILWPIYQYLVDEKLFDHIDTVAYSADFPYSVDFSADAKLAGVKLNKFTGKAGSLTGMTYFFSQVLQGDLSYLSLFSHGYFRQVPDPRLYRKASISSNESKLLKQARRHHGKKQYQSAVNALEQLTVTNPELKEAHFLLAKSLTRLELPNQALDHLQQAIQLGLYNRLVTSNDPDLKLLSKRPRFNELLKSITSRPVKLQATQGFTSKGSWRYIRKIPSQGIHSEKKSATAPLTPANSLALQPLARPKMMLAVMLAYTGFRGNSLEEISRYLERAARSDGSAPTGTVYLMANKDIRTETRYPVFDTLIKDMRRINRPAQITPGILPVGKQDVIGVVAGSQLYHWSKSKSQLLPGAIAETLTSYGGHFNHPIQTKLSEHLRHGAAGSSGAVAEPYSMWEKFPSPYLHYHYAQGVSLAEAFYQSLASPYQMLIVGDPLTKPFANSAEIIVVEDLVSSPQKGLINITPLSASSSLFSSHFELWIDGQQVGLIRPNGRFTVDSRNLADGQHELRVVAVEESPIRTRSYKKLLITVDNRGQGIRFDAQPETVQLGAMINLKGNLIGHGSSTQEVRLYRGSTHLASIPVKAGKWNYQLPSSTLGIGKSVIQLRSLHPDFLASTQFISLDVTPPPQIPPSASKFSGQPGFLATVTGNDQEERTFVQKTLDGQVSRSLGSDDLKVRYQGKFKVTGAGLHQLTISGTGQYTVQLGNNFFKDVEPISHGATMIPLSLTEGWYDLQVNMHSPLKKTPLVTISGMGEGKHLQQSWIRH